MYRRELVQGMEEMEGRVEVVEREKRRQRIRTIHPQAPPAATLPTVMTRG